MKIKYAIWISDGQVRYFDDQRQPSQGFPPVIGGVGKPQMLIWPLADIDVTGEEWDDALAEYSIEERAAARVRVTED